MNKLTKFMLAGFFLLGLVLRLVYFKETTFTWDQARDAFQALDIWRGDFIKIIGPGTAELVGLHHGSFFWYLISPFYYFSGGNVYIVRLFLILLNLTGVFIIYYLTGNLFKNKTVAAFSSFMFAVSFEAGQYGRWLSNPAPALLTVPLTFLGLWQVINNKKTGVPLLLISWALSVHFQFFLVYQLFLFVPVLIWFYQKKHLKFSKEDFIGFFGAFLILVPFLVAEVKFNFQGLKTFSFLFEEGELLKSFTTIFFKFIDRTVLTFYFNVFGFNLFLAGFLTIGLFGWITIYILKKGQYFKELIFLMVWLLSPAIAFSFEKAGAYFVAIGSLYPAIILTAFCIVKIGDKIKTKKIYFVFFALLIMLGQFIFITGQNKTGESLFSVQKSMILSDQLKVIDYVYKKSNKKIFVINTVTNPLFINTTWSYLFDWYGKKKYGYMPVWAGYPQEGQFGSEVKFAPSTDLSSLDFYLIIEPRPGIPEHMVLAISKFEDSRSKLIEKKSIGTFVVERRRLINNNNFDTDSVYKTIK